ncbi:MAG TPA: TetR/AcrR family transcriptional regulator [Anaerolineales bacterium]|nr:TetR/AcrR family transcriptional regulator [Anaerolineales bacterium]
MVKIENSKRTILNMAEDLLQYRGFNGFSYAHIASELGVKNAAIHYHFPTKEDLSRAVIKRYRDRFQLWVNNSRVKDLSPEKKLDWFLSIYNDMRLDQGKVCLVGSMEVEYNTIPEGLQEEVAALHRELLAWLDAMLAEGRESGVFHFQGEPANKAALLLSSLQGALQMARALGADKFRDVIEQLRLDLLT